MLFKKTDSLKISVLPEQEKHLSSKQKIIDNCKEPDVIAFDIYDDDTLIGFAMLREFETGGYFLWNFAIDSNYQNKHYGTRALSELICMMKAKYDMHTLTTTYIFGNKHAKYIYEKAGFIETDIVNEDGCHEVNLIYNCR